METQVEYNMRHPKRGLALIINNENFKDPRLKRRAGTQADRNSIKTRLEALQFDIKPYDDLTCEEMRGILEEMAQQEDHQISDCFVCVILSHGGEGVVYRTDGGTLDINELFDPFKGHRCKQLAGKPKLFFIETCRGQDLDAGTRADVTDALSVKMDSDEVDSPHIDSVTYRIPTEADCLMAYSTVLGFDAFRHPVKGSWFIRALCEVLEKHGTTLDLMTMMTRVNQKVAIDFESRTKKALTNKKKQMPCITSTLTKDVYFRPGQVHPTPV